MIKHPLNKLDKYQIILASKSPRRKALLKDLGINFMLEARNVDESYPEDLNPIEVAEYLAKLKSSAFPQQFIPDRQLIITADTVVISENKILGKPSDENEAFEMIKMLSNKIHSVVSGVCIKTNSYEKSFSSETKVHFGNLSDEEISYYIEKYKPYDKAGAYGIQEWIGNIGIDHIEGSFYNVMGLPTGKLYRELLEICINEL